MGLQNNKILTSGNAALVVTNLAAAGGATAPGTSTLDGVPLGTANGAATGELGAKVIIVGNTGPGGGGTYDSNPGLVTTSGVIPQGALGWSFTVVSGTVTLNGSGTLPVGASFSGGGYGGGYTLNADIPYTISAGSVLLQYDL